MKPTVKCEPLGVRLWCLLIGSPLALIFFSIAWPDTHAYPSWIFPAICFACGALETALEVRWPRHTWPGTFIAFLTVMISFLARSYFVRDPGLEWWSLGLLLAAILAGGAVMNTFQLLLRSRHPHAIPQIIP